MRYKLCEGWCELCERLYKLCEMEYKFCEIWYKLCEREYELCEREYELCERGYELCEIEKKNLKIKNLRILESTRMWEWYKNVRNFFCVFNFLCLIPKKKLKN